MCETEGVFVCTGHCLPAKLIGFHYIVLMGHFVEIFVCCDFNEDWQ